MSYFSKLDQYSYLSKAWLTLLLQRVMDSSLKLSVVSSLLHLVKTQQVERPLAVNLNYVSEGPDNTIQSCSSVSLSANDRFNFQGPVLL